MNRTGGGRENRPLPNGKEQTMIGFVVAALLAAGRSEL